MKQFFALLTALLFGLNLFQGTPAIASGRLDPRKNDQKVCTGTWKFPPLYVGGKDGVVFAEAAYEFDENCNPVLVSETRLTSVPTWVTNPSQQPVDEKTVEAVEVPASDQPNTQNNDLGVGDSILTVDTCQLRTFEEDVIYLDMIAIQTDQTYSWDNVKVTLSGGSTTATTYYPWWYRSSGPHATKGYTSSQVAWARGDASFYCQGGPFCGGQPSYNITLYNDMTVDYQGGCGGYGTYSGSVVPAGRVRYRVWK